MEIIGSSGTISLLDVDLIEYAITSDGGHMDFDSLVPYFSLMLYVTANDGSG